MHPPYSSDLAFSDHHLFSPMKEGLSDKHYTSDEEVKTAVIKWLKEQNFTRQGYTFLFKGGTVPSKETVTMLRSRNVIH